MSVYSVYLVRCGDGTLYTGIATDVGRRLSEHEHSVRGAKYLRGKGPLQLIFQQEIGDRSLATRVEHRVKRLSRAEKADADLLASRISSFVTQCEA